MWRDLLSLSRREQLGLVGLIGILFVVLALFFLSNPTKEVELDHELVEWSNNVRVAEVIKQSKSKDTVFKFNPNSESIKRLQLLGFSNLAIVSLLKYREAGGVIKSPDKLSQIYGVDSILYKRLQKYIVLDIKRVGTGSKNKLENVSFNNSHTEEVNEGSAQADKPRLIIEINSADTAMFALLKGIGPVLSKRIVSYRKKIGGYYAIKQLAEVYGLSQKVIDYNLPYLEVDESALQPMDVTSASLRQMKNHPYLDFYMAKEIYESRKEQQLDSIMQFSQSDAFANVDTAKLKRYFVVGKEASGEN